MKWPIHVEARFGPRRSRFRARSRAVRSAFPFVAVGALVLSSCATDERQAADVALGATARAREALVPFKRELMKALTTALQEGGPESAIEVCRLRVRDIAAATSTEGIQIGRTSHRVRNPDNAPAPWMQELLQQYAAAPADTAARSVRLDAEHIGYVEPIHVKPLCLTCHGEEIAPSLHERLRVQYPQDQATGFREGDFRGLFWVRVRDPL